MRSLRESGMTMIVVSHEMGFARNAADRVVFMDEGAIVEEGPPAAIFENPAHERTRAFIGQIQRHIFLCAEQTKPKCAPVEITNASWDHLKKRLNELRLTGAETRL